MWRQLLVVAMTTAMVVSGDRYRLPTAVLPHHYDLRLLIDIDPASNFTYYGIVEIEVNCNTGTDKIVLHGKKFKILENFVKVMGGESSYEVASAAITDTELDLLTIQLNKPLDAGLNYTVVIPFYGNLEEELNGVYISSYENKTTNQKEYLVTTQFEAIAARKGFPCFDEPAMKATFAVTLGHNKEFTAVSNMPLANVTDKDTGNNVNLWEEMMKSRSLNNNLSGPEIVWSHFETSVSMSTYLLAFVISKFAYIESPGSLSHAKFRVYARSDAIDQAEYASSIGPVIISHYEKYFDIPYPLPKQDMFAIPDFAAGAMENWGLITYRETALLYDKNESSLSAKQRVAEVVAHELAHQWFGNLVTMNWWSDLWLNEGFATYVESVGVDAAEPKWNRLDEMAVEEVNRVLVLDALTSSHPVLASIEDPKTISEIFDTISYSKGCVIIRMMVKFLSDEVFRSGIKSYLMKYAYSNAAQDDLWASLTEAAKDKGVLPDGVTVKTIMDTWTRQTGYPLITVNRNYNDKSVTITQKRYLSLDNASNGTESWWLPITTLSESQANTKEKPSLSWLSNTEGIQEFTLPITVEKNEWLLLNPDMMTLYRVNYDAQNWQLISNAVNSDQVNSIPKLSRVQLLSDSFQLAWTNKLDYNVAFNLVKYLHRETELLPIEAGITALNKIGAVLKRTKDFGAFQKFMRKLITKIYQDAGGLHTKSIMNPDDAEKVKLQVLLSSTACKMDVPNCEQNAIDLFREWMAAPNPDKENPIPLELRATVYCVAVRRGSVEHWAFLFQRYQNSNVAAAKRSMMTALSCTREIWILKQFLEWTVDDGPEVRRQDAAGIVSSVAESHVGYFIAKQFVYSRIEDIERSLVGQKNRLGSIIKSLAYQFTTEDELNEFIQWRSKNEKYLTAVKLSVEQAIETSRVYIDWLKRNQVHVAALLREKANSF